MTPQKQITVTFCQYRAALSEWLSRKQINAFMSEIISLYSAGYAAADVGPLIRVKAQEQGR